VGISLLGVTVYSMKKIIALLVTIGASVGGFLWWKRHQVTAANDVSADPWPAAVVPAQAPPVESPVDIAAPAIDPTGTKSKPKKSTSKKQTPKKATQESD
jgi:hypothetical protein